MHSLFSQHSWAAGLTCQTWCLNHEMRSSIWEMTWLNFSGRGNANGQHQMSQLSEIVWRRQLRMLCGQLLGITRCLPIKASTYPVLLYNSWITIALSKHRKRHAQNMSQSEVNLVSSHIFDCLQAVPHYWSERHWSAFKGEVEQLAQSIHRYSEYLQRSCKKSCFRGSPQWGRCLKMCPFSS